MYKICTRKPGMANRYIHKIWMIMRLTTVILIATLMQVSAAGFAQRITIKVNKVALEEVLLNIRDQSGYDFVFERGDFKGLNPINMAVRNVSLDEAINSALSGQPLTYNIEGKVVVIKRKEHTILDRITGILASINVQGRVVDAENKGLLGATVTIKGTKRSVITNANGSFTFPNVDEKAVLVISYLGFETRELGVKADLGAIQMVQSSGSLDEVAVTVSTGYQNIPKERAAGSFSVIDSKTLEKRNIYNVTDYLQGRVSGLLVSPTNIITIRGRSTLTSNQGALIVVDGYPINRSMESINPNDIESITVLKDASAASIWGVRAANGVIVIQTKRNSNKALDIAFSTSVSISARPDLSELPLASSASFLDYEKFKVDHNMIYVGAPPFRRALSQGLDAYINHPSTAAALIEPLKGINVYDEFSDLFLQSAVRQQYSFSISGKSEKSFQRASFNFDDAQSTFKNTGSKRYVADLFQRNSLSSKLTTEVGINFGYVNSKTNGMTLNDLSNITPYQRILDENGGYIPQPMTFAQADKDALVNAGYPYSWDYNMSQEFKNKNNSASALSLSATAGLNYAFTKNFSFNSGYKFELTNGRNYQLQNEETYFVRNMINYSTREVDGSLASGVPKGGILMQIDGAGQTHIFRNQIKYDGPVFNKDHQLTVIGGMEMQQVDYNSTRVYKYGFNPQTLQYAAVNYVDPYTAIDGGKYYLSDQSAFTDSRNRYVSYYANAGYTYLEKYSVNGSARQDRTNLFGASDKYKHVILWSAGLSWQAYKESFLENGPFSSLIVRASYGVNGNVDRSTSPLLVANVGTDYTTNQPNAYVVNPENPLLRWEKTTVANIGVDFTTLNGRLSGTVEYYNRKSTDLLGNSVVNGTYGFNSAYINYASMNNRGIDIHLSAQILRGAIFLNAMLNYSYNKNEVLDVYFPQATAGSYIAGAPQSGLPLDYLYSYRWAGLSSAGAPRVYNQKGDIIDFTTEMIDQLGLVYQGTTVSPHYGGFFTEVGFKQFSLTAGLTFKAGHKFRVPVIQYRDLYYASSTSGGLSSDWDNKWNQAGDENTTNIPAMPTSQAGLALYDQYPKYADVNVKDASTVRFQELILNYKLPGRILSKSSTALFNLGVQVRNLGVYTFNKNKLDPEFLSTSQFIVSKPTPEFTLMLKANF